MMCMLHQQSVKCYDVWNLATLFLFQSTPMLFFFPWKMCAFFFCTNVGNLVLKHYLLNVCKGEFEYGNEIENDIAPFIIDQQMPLIKFPNWAQGFHFLNFIWHKMSNKVNLKKKKKGRKKMLSVLIPLCKWESFCWLQSLQ